jgi:VanZ family protein
MRILAAIAVLGILYLSLFPFDFTPYRHRPHLIWTPLAMPSDRVDIVANLLAYTPIGFLGLGALGDRRWRSAAAVTGAAALLSLGIESAQLYLPSRSGSYRDLVCNTAGAFAGAALAVSIRGFDARIISLLPSPRGALFLACWVLWNNFPLMLSLRRSKLHALPGQLAQWNWSPVEALDCTLASFTLYALLREGREPAVRWLVPAIIAIPAALQFLVINIPFSAVRTSAVLLGLALAVVAWKPARRPYWTALAVALAAWVLIRQLQPFVFSRIPSNFGWWPAEGFYSLDLSRYVRILAGKLFLYASVLAAFSLAGRSLARTAVWMAAAIGFTEFLQRWLPERTPETTDVALVAAAALLLHAVRDRRVARSPVPAQ